MIPRCHSVCIDCLTKYGIKTEVVNAYEAFWPCPYASTISPTQREENAYNSKFIERDLKRLGQTHIYFNKPIGHECPNFIDHLLKSLYPIQKPTRRDKKRKKKARTKTVCKCCRDSWDLIDEKLWKKYQLVQCPALKKNNPYETNYDSFDKITNPVPEQCALALEHLICS